MRIILSMSFYPGPWPKTTKFGHFDNIYLVKMPIGRRVAYVINISSHSEHYKKHAVIHWGVNANVLYYIFMVVILSQCPIYEFC
jgi:hypothetical protein